MSGNDTFPLSDLHPGWRGRRLVTLRAWIEDGMEASRRDFDAMPDGSYVPLAICTLVSEVDPDGLTETIAAIDAADWESTAHVPKQRLATLSDRFLSKPGWRMLDENPAALSGVPPHQYGVKLGDGGGFNSAYVRIWVIRREPGEDLLSVLLDTLPLEAEFVAYFMATTALESAAR